MPLPKDKIVNIVDAIVESRGLSLRQVGSEAAAVVAIAEGDALPLPTGAATSANQDTQTTLLQGIAGFTVTGYDYIALTYVAAGNGAGEIETATFKTGGSGGTTIATLTLAYNASNEISSVTKT